MLTHTRVQPVAPSDRERDRDEVGHYLVMIEGGDPGRWFLLGPGTITIGRDKARDVVLADPDVSRLHACISVSFGRVIVEDQHSTNGTFIDGRQVTRPAVLAEGSLLIVGQHVLKLERRSKREVERSQEIKRDLDRASQYVRSLLPPPLVGGPIRTDWLLLPSAQLGGDAFGYDWLDPDTFLIYLIDVSGHGAGAAMHTVSALNVLRQRALDADLREPAAVLASLNAMFQMDRYDGMIFTMWYGVYDVPQRTLRYACAGHHPAYLVSVSGSTPAPLALTTPLKTRGPVIGAMPEMRYRADQTIVPPDSSLYLFSDGVFEIVTKDGQQWGLYDFIPLLTQQSSPDSDSFAELPESQRLYRAVKAVARPGPFDDDFSLLVVTFT
jgi:serine phosphatase RsbU (regulator of sigma subunit)